jgi:hypothetical protein
MASTLFTAALVIGVIILFIAIFSRLHRQRQNKKLAKQQTVFESIVSKYNLQISEKEEINAYMFAIDKSANKLIYLNFDSPQEETTLIDLHRVKSVKVNTEEDSVFQMKRGKSVLVDKHVTKLQVEVNFKNANQPPQLLVFYQYEDGMQNLAGTKRRGEHWQNVINSCIKQLSDSATHKV